MAFTKVFEDSVTGGWVELDPVFITHETDDNLKTAKLLAKNGYQVRLLPILNQENRKNPDALLIKENQFIEFKHNTKPTRSAIENEIRRGKTQANYLLLHIKSKIARGAFIHEVKYRINLSSNVKMLWVVWKDCLYVFKRKEIFDGTFEKVIK